MDPQTAEQTNVHLLQKRLHRRKFLLFTTTAATAAVIGVSCDKDDEKMANTGGVNLGSGDTGILNYAYALEQLEAAFYTQVMATPFSGITAMESEYLFQGKYLTANALSNKGIRDKKCSKA